MNHDEIPPALGIWRESQHGNGWYKMRAGLNTVEAARVADEMTTRTNHNHRIECERTGDTVHVYIPK